MDVDALRGLVEAAYRDRALLRSSAHEEAVLSAVDALDRGVLRVAERAEPGGAWVTHAWLKEAILLYFALRKMEVMEAGPFEFHDKIPLKRGLDAAGVRVVPPGTVRYGAFLEAGAIVMPGYVNIGARVGAGTMVDTWATVGSCAQIGRDCHLSGGVGIGGVLEPPSAQPVIVEDGAFIGSRVIVVEGVVVGEEAVLGAGVVLTSSTAILDVSGPEVVEYRGRVPPRSVVIPGTRPKTFPAGTFGVPCALIIGHRTAATDRKVSLNSALRDFGVAV
ncbi:2,3,4,5-tetrahydropyridine-2,6-dicarboxylate N-succinyltransferase [Chondromyces crocatus]|uniref:2,3,4,5-tetrahydropyridine-2,6-carboxylate N-succinyltransferase n=1 Tax=Chondromyces crocatus TaxID=52 RepID=A0A0K1ELE2_CHOCO|nr:2,3,4,5-tetrahydropyridine-2,6-dicarboxylate N-succinyltransferase [Chondromyces crocatus]AKT41433.1 2,3,4,5-tetrahydropyridine-2,6-carboxylate N-succinyltransferase [Chondromyces crocatus]